MRVTSRMMKQNYLNDMRRNLNNLNKINGQLTSGKEIRRPSDDPFKVARSMSLNDDINTNKQYNNNIVDTMNFLDATDTALNGVTNAFQRVRELMVSSGNAAYGSDEKGAIKDEINQKIEEIGQILNTNFDGRYIFAGSNGTSKPVDVMKDENGNSKLVFLDREGKALESKNESDYKCLESELKVEISKGVVVDYNVPITNITSFKDSDGKSFELFDVLSDITKNLGSLKEEDGNLVIEENLEAMDKNISNLMKVRGRVGAIQNRMELALSKNEEENLNLKEILSKNEDIDFTEKSMEAAMAQTVYMASLQTSAKVLPQTLMDFLR